MQRSRRGSKLEINRSSEIIKLLQLKTHISKKDLPHTKEEYDRILRKLEKKPDEYQLGLTLLLIEITSSKGYPNR
ncbi:hypothetical protein CEXT_341821 [Caerostris extrusa]|uniref:Uncharacterized protein n=1 Tax=Caerostris extrusa TaxID=172846 RepID=A0AAV4QUY5_CAEEX|nr:hypothetical protein CEXT_341821 [Caerostris extrusa]